MSALLAATLFWASGQTPLLRLQPDPRANYAVDLRVSWPEKKQQASLSMLVHFVEERQDLRMQIDLMGARVGERNATKDLLASLKSRRVEMGWTRRAIRASGMTPLQIGSLPPQLAPLLAEAGIYLCEFPEGAMRTGKTWRGNTTATGGCTSGLYRFDGVAKSASGGVARISVENIALRQGRQVTPMRFEVDVTTGLPLRMTYEAEVPEKGGRMVFEQVMRPITLPPMKRLSKGR